MKNKISAIIIALVFFGCEDRIFPDLATNDPIIVVDAWINDQPTPQIIKLTTTQPYFDNSLPSGVPGATITVTSSSGKKYDFNAQGADGEYVWAPSAEVPHISGIGETFTIEINVDGKKIISNSRMGRVPPIDSVRFHFVKASQIFPDAYFAEFFARDPVGRGDTYWIRTWKNGKPLNKPSEISVAYDAGFSAGGPVDGLVFIQPIRDSVNPFDVDQNDSFLAPYLPGDSVYVELHSISNDAFDFLNRVVIQTNRSGGFGELFAEPLSNVGTNLTRTDGGKVLGYFNVAAVSKLGAKLDPNNLPGPRNQL